MSDGLRVHGGAGGISVRLDELEHLGHALVRYGHRSQDIAGDLLRVSADIDLTVSRALSPGTAGAAITALVSTAAHLAAIGSRLDLLGRCVLGCVQVYRGADAVADAAIRGAQDGAGFVVGVNIGLRWSVVAVAIGGGVVASAAVSRYRGPGADRIRDAADQRRLQTVDHIGDVLASNPWLMSTVGGGAEGLAAGLGVSGVLGSPLGVVTVTAGGPGVFAGSRQRLLDGFPAGPGPAAEAREVLLGGVLDRGAAVGYLDDGVAGSAVPLSASITRSAGPVRAPANLRDLARSMDQVGRRSLPDDEVADDPMRSRVRITRVPQPQGGNAWIVVIAGTQSWSVTAGAVPNDLTSNVALVAGADAALVDAVDSAMRQADIRPDEPVLVAGHSQGGIVAAAMAADAASAYRITHVYTEGSPIADMAVPDHVDVLSVEHAEDLVPALDDGPGTNPDRARWTTVTAASTQPPAPAGHADPGLSFAPVEAHDSAAYQNTAALLDESQHESIVTWRNGADMFFRGDGTITEYQLSRTPSPQRVEQQT